MRAKNTIFNPTIYTTAFLYAAITFIGAFSFVNLFNGELAFGIGCLFTFITLLVIYFKIDKIHHSE